MYERHSSLSARELVDDLLPKLKATEHFLEDTLNAKAQHSPEPREQLRLRNLKAEFELEVSMIRMNLKHLLRRYSQELTSMGEGDEDFLLELDEHEVVAIESMRQLFQRTHELQTNLGERVDV